MIHDSILFSKDFHKPPVRPTGNQIADPLKLILYSCIVSICLGLTQPDPLIHQPSA